MGNIPTYVQKFNISRQLYASYKSIRPAWWDVYWILLSIHVSPFTWTNQSLNLYHPVGHKYLPTSCISMNSTQLWLLVVVIVVIIWFQVPTLDRLLIFQVVTHRTVPIVVNWPVLWAPLPSLISAIVYASYYFVLLEQIRHA